MVCWVLRAPLEAQPSFALSHHLYGKMYEHAHDCPRELAEHSRALQPGRRTYKIFQQSRCQNAYACSKFGWNRPDIAEQGRQLTVISRVLLKHWKAWLLQGAKSAWQPWCVRHVKAERCSTFYQQDHPNKSYSGTSKPNSCMLYAKPSDGQAKDHRRQTH